MNNEKYSDADRLKWAMENMHTEGVYKEFAFDVMKRAGVGDMGDIRHFIDMKMDEQGCTNGN